MKAEEEVDWREGRRRRGMELLGLGWRPSRIAEALGVSKASVSHWSARAGQDPSAWQTRPRTGRPAKLTQEQLEMIPDMLSHGAEAWGFLGEVWTCERVAKVVHRQFGVSYHKAHVARLLKKLRWSPQVPIQRASQRDEAAIERWRNQTWPLLKKKPVRKVGKLSSSTNRACT
jgi:transposase